MEHAETLLAENVLRRALPLHEHGVQRFNLVGKQGGVTRAPFRALTWLSIPELLLERPYEREQTKVRQLPRARAPGSHRPEHQRDYPQDPDAPVDRDLRDVFPATGEG